MKLFVIEPKDVTERDHNDLLKEFENDELIFSDYPEDIKGFATYVKTMSECDNAVLGRSWVSDKVPRLMLDVCNAFDIPRIFQGG